MAKYQKPEDLLAVMYQGIALVRVARLERHNQLELGFLAVHTLFDKWDSEFLETCEVDDRSDLKILGFVTLSRQFKDIYASVNAIPCMHL